MEYPKIACAMIVKGTSDEAPLLATALASINGHVDDFYLCLNTTKGKKISSKVRAIAEQYVNPANISITEWTGDFVGTRNLIFGKVPKKYDWIMWLDSDDTIDNPEKIREVIAIASKQTQGIFLKYDYDHDDLGNVTVSHWVCRIVRNNGIFTWKSSFDDDEVTVHETLCETRSVSKVMNDEVKIVHHSDPDRRAASLQRNLALLDGMYDRQYAKGNVDPRILFYLGTHCYDAMHYARAKSLLQQYMQLSGWAEERSEALVYLGNILRLEGKIDQAKHAYLLATGENTNNSRAYIELAEIECKYKRYAQAIDLLNIAISRPKPKTTVVIFPMEYTFRASMLLAQAQVNIGGKSLEDAYKNVQAALKLRPLDLDAQRARDMIEELIVVRDETKAALRLINSLDKEEKSNSIIDLLNSLPDKIQDNPAILAVRHKYTTPKKWPKKSIAIYVGPSPLGIWGPWSLKEGISGSEEAVIQLSQLLADMGWQVDIYATPGERDGYYTTQGKSNLSKTRVSNICWHQYWQFNPKDNYDILIGWRSPWFFDGNYKARKQYLWLHDVIDKEELTEERLAKLDKVIFVSQYHANLFKEVVPEDKQFVSGNGINPAQFEQFDEERDPFRCIYTSAHERGLRLLYDVWPDVKAAVPEASLDVYYGWDGYDAINRDNPERMQWKAELIKQEKSLKALGVVDHGRVGHDDIAKAMSRSGVFAYPCVFPEVYCISYVKAMAAGAWPVTSDFAVLKEYAQWATQVHLDTKDYENFRENYKLTLIDYLKRSSATEGRRTLMAETARQNYSWKATAREWDMEMRLRYE